MKKPTQHDKIKELYATQVWVCQLDFWKISKSPHTRRREIKEEGQFHFIETPCTHGHDRIYDYAMVENDKPIEKPLPQRPKIQMVERNGEMIALLSN